MLYNAVFIGQSSGRSVPTSYSMLLVLVIYLVTFVPGGVFIPSLAIDAAELWS